MIMPLGLPQEPSLIQGQSGMRGVFVGFYFLLPQVLGYSLALVSPFAHSFMMSPFGSGWSPFGRHLFMLVLKWHFLGILPELSIFLTVHLSPEDLMFLNCGATEDS